MGSDFQVDKALPLQNALRRTHWMTGKVLKRAASKTAVNQEVSQPAKNVLKTKRPEKLTEQFLHGFLKSFRARHAHDLHRSRARQSFSVS